MSFKIVGATFFVSVLALVAACASNKPPAATPDGLVLQPDSTFSEVYVRPGVSLTGFNEIGLVPCQVAFKNNWLRDQNTNRLDLGNRVTQKDVDRIKDSLGELCDTYFHEALQREPAYTLVDQFDEGEAVLVLRPGIVNLDIAAPDIRSPGVSRTYTTEAGEMTLNLEAVDATTGEVLVRVIDRRRSTDYGRMQWTNGVTNSAEARRTLRRWSDQLREGLDEAMKP